MLVIFTERAWTAEAEFGDVQIVHLLEDHPNYFLFGRPQTKAQLSFKVKVFKATDIYLAYTQKIFWDLFEPSSPFRDINYNPSVFYRFQVGGDETKLIDFIPYEHESNGKKGNDSRSWDRTGVRFKTLQRFGNARGIWNFRAWAPYRLDDPNPDLAKYRGLFEVTFTLADFLGPYFDLNDLSLRIYFGGSSYLNPLQGGQELTFRFKGKTVGFLANAVVQVFQGFGENMLEYNHRIFGLRAGIGL